MRFIFLYFCLIGVLVSTVRIAESADRKVSLELTNIPGHAVSPDGSKFLPVGYPLPARLEWQQDMSADPLCPTLRILDSRSREISKIDMDFPIREQAGIHSIECLITVPLLSHSQIIRFEVAFQSCTARSDSTADPVISDWQLLREDYVLMNERLPRLGRGWHTLERRTPPDPAGRWSMTASMIELTDPIRPMILRFIGTTNPDCLENHRLKLELFHDAELLASQIIERAEFTFTTIIKPREFNRNPSISMPECPLSNTPLRMVLKADQSFVPSECMVSDDTRRLSFSMRNFEFCEWVPVTGFYSGTQPQGLVWAGPEAAFLIPNSTRQSTLFVQGRRDVRCVSEPQTIKVFLGDRQIGTEVASTAGFCLKIPITAEQLGNEPLAIIRFTVEPLFFKSQCSDLEDANPYGVAIESIALLE